MELSPIETVPPEIFCRLLPFLNIYDCLHLSKSSKTVRGNTFPSFKKTTGGVKIRIYDDCEEIIHINFKVNYGFKRNLTREWIDDIDWTAHCLLSKALGSTLVKSVAEHYSRIRFENFKFSLWYVSILQQLFEKKMLIRNYGFGQGSHA